MDKQEKYKKYLVSDFLYDEYFQDWVMRPDLEMNRFWEQWLSQNPEKEAIVTAARNILSSLDFKVNQPDPERAKQSLEKTLTVIDILTVSKPANAPVVSIGKMWKFAALFILVIGIGALVYYETETKSTNEVSTSFGKIDMLLLPDQSSVVLNANSNLRYNKKWQKSNPRELWLKGEAFFNVKHINAGKQIEPYVRFLVHVQDATIEVLGTTFNVRERRGKTEIVLQKGSVKVSFTNHLQPDVIMKPGDLLVIDPSAKEKVIYTTTNPDNYSAWTKKRLVLTNPTLNEIVNYLEDTYGKKIILRDPKLAFKRVNGPILLDSLEDALFVISTVLNVSITEEGNTLVVLPK